MGISENADSPLLCSREIKLMQYSKDDLQQPKGYRENN